MQTCRHVPKYLESMQVAKHFSVPFIYVRGKMHFASKPGVKYLDKTLQLKLFVFISCSNMS